ncbi:ABC transporter ATP-binding protein [Bacillus sp. DTU_2020_1000418_1_SI_GHA_SEK_038]|uniref:ABC transporter ATP-binding protein n=1 Tax=Bacillus sp. DTU_2020_1000418_1_SI_GHA_SEK_038 TaxID=3077585 RepID=UPI0028E1BE8B|nr:ABC transporter ATP-binding protein [Bacillus sp. DTU_2020_1000418_1_SI_GHA_SEK_038]WNS74409.1 ABC transporter ATP-binding protein [Bacillus sp. DTU_2020_1000418_1_SI_GHA_SEK_038]
MSATVEIQNVTKIINGRTIIDSLSFNVNKGEVFGFLGPNGAGKTTTIRMIVGLIGMTSGDIKILGHSINADFEKAITHVGAIVENPEMYKFMSGYQNLIHYARMSKGVSKEKINETVELVGLTDRIHDKVKTYSLGMRQRLGLAQCLLHDPKVLILDEPTNGLDPAGIREIRDHLRMLARERDMAVIVSSHLLSEMEMMCDRIGIIQYGKLIDVQLISDFVQGNEKVYEMEVDKKEKASSIIGELFSELQVKLTENGIAVPLKREVVPVIVKELVKSEIQIYGIKEMTKTLEDRFLEVTSTEVN